MTTVTEAAKRLVGGDDEEAIRNGDVERMCADPVLAQRFARRLVAAAREISPGREWGLEDLRDVFDVACRGPRDDGVRILEGRFFRKRLREQAALSERYGDPFAVVVFRLRAEHEAAYLESAIDAAVERLRRTDMVFVYRRRIALVLPRMRREAVDPLVARVRALLKGALGEDVVEDVATLCMPDPAVGEVTAVLDWAEDQLR
ncbi:MAG: hypothetical protein NZ898_15640 [Myxococcota bacterium]|nr:hypothetical protein [Myxococcota bacterium]MDW8361800.1 hypothetical protein [Myxococcales bacterium]